jgi:hypothetical protein
MNSFTDFSKLFSRAFDSQQYAANKQAQAQQVGMDWNKYSADVTDTHFDGPTPPEKGPYGTFESPVVADEDPTESMKAELLAKARSNQRPTDGHVSIRAGGGVNPAVRR